LINKEEILCGKAKKGALKIYRKYEKKRSIFVFFRPIFLLCKDLDLADKSGEKNYKSGANFAWFISHDKPTKKRKKGIFPGVNHKSDVRDSPVNTRTPAILKQNSNRK